jgi:acyl-CoA thioester hydrolase
MQYRLEHRVSHADVDFLGELKVAAWLGLLEQAAVEASTACGYDAARYTREARIWIIRRTQLERLAPVGGVDRIEVETQVADFRRARSLRRYVARRDGQCVAQALTDWVYCDITTGRPVRIPAELQSALVGEAGAPALPRDATLPAAPEAGAVELAVNVQPSHLDHVVHVNNGIYAHFLEDGAFALFAARGWPLARMLAAGGALRVQRLDCEYLADAHESDELLVRSWLWGETTIEGGATPAPVQLLQTIIHVDGRLLLRARSDWVWRRKPPIIGGVPE